MQQLIDEPSAAEMVASLVHGTATHEGHHVAISTSFRLPVHLVANVDALAAHSRKTRTAMLVLLLEVGLEEVSKHLDSATLEQISIEASGLMGPMLEVGQGEAY